MVIAVTLTDDQPLMWRGDEAGCGQVSEWDN
jgi:hypothetical protein